MDIKIKLKVNYFYGRVFQKPPLKMSKIMTNLKIDILNTMEFFITILT